MSVVLTSTTQRYIRTANLPTITAFTITGWAFFTNLSGFRGVFNFGEGTGPHYMGIYMSNDTLKASNDSGGLVGNGGTLVQSQWYFLAITVSGTGASALNVYLDGATSPVITAAGSSGPTATELSIGSGVSGAEPIDAHFVAVKVWDAVLTGAQIASERLFGYPQLTTGINGCYLLQSDVLTDVSGLSNNLVHAGSGAITTAGDPTGGQTIDFSPPGGAGPVPSMIQGPIILVTRRQVTGY
jgi:hypothetical protein